MKNKNSVVMHNARTLSYIYTLIYIYTFFVSIPFILESLSTSAHA